MADRDTKQDRSEIATESLRPLAKPAAMLPDIGRAVPLEAAAMPAPPVLPLFDGRYQAQAQLGSGGMAVVLLARDLRLERLVALKVLHPELAKEPDHVERFRREALMLAMVESPFVVPVYDVAISPEHAYLVMRYVPGRSLADEIAARSAFTPRRAAAIVLGILDGVRELHAKRLVHRDLKLANVVLGDDGRPVLVDLGIALDRQRRSLTRSGFVAGTPALMAPEQRSGIEADERVDLFQAGTVLAQLVLGREAIDDAALDAVPPILAQVIRAATAPLDQRYRSASEMAAALGAVVRKLGG